MREVLPDFMLLISAGIVIVTLLDGQEYTCGLNNPAILMQKGADGMRARAGAFATAGRLTGHRRSRTWTP